MRILWGPLAAGLLLAGCGNTQRVEKPLGEVYTILSSMPRDIDALELATAFPGVDYYLEPSGDELIWHFRHEGKDYGRFIARIHERGTTATDVTTRFENDDEGRIPGVEFMRNVARMAGEESVTAALSGKTYDRAAFHEKFVQAVGTDPMGAGVATIQTVSGEMDRMIAEEEAEKARNLPAYPKPGVLPTVGGGGGPRDDR